MSMQTPHLPRCLQDPSWPPKQPKSIELFVVRQFGSNTSSTICSLSSRLQSRPSPRRLTPTTPQHHLRARPRPPSHLTSSGRRQRAPASCNPSTRPPIASMSAAKNSNSLEDFSVLRRQHHPAAPGRPTQMSPIRAADSRGNTEGHDSASSGSGQPSSLIRLIVVCSAVRNSPAC
jgi:hypothetical protein